MMTYETRGFIDDLVDKRKKHKDLTIRNVGSDNNESL